MTPCVLLALAVPTRQNIRMPRGWAFWLICAVGLLDTTAYVANTIGFTTRDVAVVSVLASLFSTVTVLLAWLFLRERLHWSQWMGIGVIFVGITLISLWTLALPLTERRESHIITMKSDEFTLIYDSAACAHWRHHQE